MLGSNVLYLGKCVFMFGFKKRKWRNFRNLETAIRIAQQRGADVKWGEKLNGALFDAILVAPYSNAKYLVAIKCVDSTTPLPRQEALEFAGIAESARINLGILVLRAQRGSRGHAVTSLGPSLSPARARPRSCLTGGEWRSREGIAALRDGRRSLAS